MAVLIEWAYRPTEFRNSPVVVPYVSRTPCRQPHEFGWICSRRTEHGGRHAALMDSGEVVAVWL